MRSKQTVDCLLCYLYFCMFTDSYFLIVCIKIPCEPLVKMTDLVSSLKLESFMKKQNVLSNHRKMHRCYMSNFLVQSLDNIHRCLYDVMRPCCLKMKANGYCFVFVLWFLFLHCCARHTMHGCIEIWIDIKLFSFVYFLMNGIMTNMRCHCFCRVTLRLLSAICGLSFHVSGFGK